MNDKKMIAEILECLHRYLNEDRCLRDHVAVYQSSDGRIYCSPYAGVPAVRRDLGEQIIWKWKEGDYSEITDEQLFFDIEFSLTE